MHYTASQYYKIYNIVHTKVTCAGGLACAHTYVRTYVCMYLIVRALFQSSPLYYVFKLFCLQNRFENLCVISIAYDKINVTT
jgi:hypothetical protein